MFTISYTINNVGVKKAICDLGASIILMLLFIYESSNVGPVKEKHV